MYRLHHYRWVPGLTFRRHARDPSPPGRIRPGVDADVWMAVLPAPAGGRKPGQTPPERNSCRPTWPPARPPMSAGRSRRPMAPAGSKLGAATPRERPLDLDGCHMGDQLSHLLHVQETTPRFLRPPPPPPFFFLPGNRALSRSPRLTISEPGYLPAVENPTASLPFPHYGLIRAACRRTAKNQPLSDP